MKFIYGILIGAAVAYLYALVCPDLELLNSSRPRDKAFDCPYCGRRLLIVHEDKKIDLAGMASADTMVQADIIKGPEPTVITEKDMVFTGAECMRPICRLRAWWGKEK